MFIRATTIVLSAIALTGFATAVPSAALKARGGSSSTCNSGAVQCCTSVQSSDSYAIDELFGLLGLPLPPAGTLVGFTCFPIPIVLDGTGSGGTCTQQTVCCDGDTFNGISTGCSPITINM